MLEIGLYRTLVCDNGKKYMICEGNEFYDFRLCEGDWLKEVNKVHRDYLEDAIKFNQTICVGRLDYGNCEYATIVDVEGSERDKMRINAEWIERSIEEMKQMSIGIKDTIAKSNIRKRNR